MTVTLTLPVLVSIVLLAMLVGAGFAFVLVWIARLSARVSQLERLLSGRVTYSTSTEMAVAE